MPRPFSEGEKKQLHSRLISSGQELFGQYGLKKTSVDDITRHTGIAKGTFYLFFENKEIFFFKCLEKYELTVQEQEIIPFINGITNLPLVKRLEQFFHFILDLFDKHPLFRRFLEDGDIHFLMEALPPEILQEHQKKDEEEAFLYFNLIFSGLKATPLLNPISLNTLFTNLVMLKLNGFKSEGGGDWELHIQALSLGLTALAEREKKNDYSQESVLPVSRK